MRRLSITLAIVLLAANSLFAQLPPDSVLRRYAAGMLMVGFRGDSVTEDCDAARYVRDLKVGAIVLFDIDMTGEATLGSRNITSKERLTRMTSQLQAWADYPLLIATDQEGGKVARLKPQYGFLPTVTATTTVPQWAISCAATRLTRKRLPVMQAGSSTNATARACCAPSSIFQATAMPSTTRTTASWT